MSAAARARLSTLPPVVWLAAIVVGSIGLRMLLAGRTVSPWIMVDELIYSELGEVARRQRPVSRPRRPEHGYGFVYPVLLAPACGLFDSVPTAYAPRS